MKTEDIDYKADLLSKLPELKLMEGFPIGKDDDIIELSDPPYYTACPNPYINEFIEKYGKPYDEATDDYHREPFVGDVSEGKNDPIYNAHSYHTKVPHKAIMKYIKHYTNEGDIVLDGFCGTGMTGVAAQLLNRKAILSDLSPIATFIAYNYNNPVDILEFKREANRVLKEVEKECGWMYETTHYINGKPAQTKGRINYMVWSDVFICPNCKKEYVFYEVAVNKEESKVVDDYHCPNCNSLINKRLSERIIEKNIFNDTIPKQIPVLIKYFYNSKLYEKKPDTFDFELIKKINDISLPFWFPNNKIPNGEKTHEAIKLGFETISSLYSQRSIYALSYLYSKIYKNDKKLLFILMSIVYNLVSRLTRYNLGNRGNGIVAGTLFIPSLFAESNVMKSFNKKFLDISKALIHKYKESIVCVNTSSTTNLHNVSNNIVDYIFTDPPFGDNIMYSELNYIWESWLRIFTNNKAEAIINHQQGKKLFEYHGLMLSSFKEYYRVLKPNRWITVEFHNSKSSVWNAIQEAMTKAGFIIAQVAVLDKQQGSFNQVQTSTGAVKNDLVISAYKPAKSFEERLMKDAGKDFEIEFVKDFLDKLPCRPIIERTAQMLFSKMLAYYVLRGYEVTYNSTDFYTMLPNHFVEEDSLWFNPQQISHYRTFKQQMKLKDTTHGAQGALMLFVTDEKSAIIWLTNFLSEPQSFSDIHSAFTKLLNKQDDAMPELTQILLENFIQENDTYRKPSNTEEISSLGEKRNRQLLKHFETLLLEAAKAKKKIKIVRREALAYGMETYFRNRRYREIVELSKKLDPSIIDNNAEISMFIETAELEVEGL